MALVAMAALPGGSDARAAPERPPSAVSKISCDRACLVGVVDQYMKAFVARDWRRLPWADHVKMTENNTAMKAGDGAWAVVTGKGPQDLTVADPLTGQAAYMGVIELNGIPAWYALRLKVIDRKIAEVEYVWRPRPANLNPATPGASDPRSLKHDPAWYDDLQPNERTPRSRMLDLANGYFSTLQRNDGRIFTEFDPVCTRNDNGTVTSGVPDSPNPLYRLNCGEQFKTGLYFFDNAVRERDYPLVDEQKGVVLARAFLDHNAQVIDFKLTDGTPRTSSFKTPHTFGMMELFKIRSGKLYRISVTHIDVPYHSSSPWTPPSQRE
ncbi:MAG: hypothetical protein ABIO39_15205 [Caulobacteraceae bacterium]